MYMFGSPYFQTFKFPDSLWTLESLLKENYRHAGFISCSPPHVSIVQNLWYIVWYFRFLYNLTLLKKFDISQQSLLFAAGHWLIIPFKLFSIFVIILKCLVLLNKTYETSPRFSIVKFPGLLLSRVIGFQKCTFLKGEEKCVKLHTHKSLKGKN